jgi:histidyl-tRNA synthetase
MELDARGVRAQMKRADRLAARLTLIVGGDELARGEVTLRDMTSGEQRAVPRAEAVAAARAATHGARVATHAAAGFSPPDLAG